MRVLNYTHWTLKTSSVTPLQDFRTNSHYISGSRSGDNVLDGLEWKSCISFFFLNVLESKFLDSKIYA